MNSMAGEQPQATTSPRDGEDVGITIGCPKVVFSSMCTKRKFSLFLDSSKNVLYITFIWFGLQETEPKLGTMMGVFVPCLQNILGIIYYIRFTW